MTTKQQIVENIFELHIPQKVWRFGDTYTLEDFSQYCYQLLLEVPDDLFFKLSEEGQIANYFYVMCRRQSQPSSAFWREHVGRLDEVTLDETKELDYI